MLRGGQAGRMPLLMIGWAGDGFFYTLGAAMQKDVILQISNKIKEKRKERQITLQELADKAGVTKGFISQIENNRTVPSLTVLLSIIRSLNIDLNAFFDELQG